MVSFFYTCCTRSGEICRIEGGRSYEGRKEEKRFFAAGSIAKPLITASLSDFRGVCRVKFRMSLVVRVRPAEELLCFYYGDHATISDCILYR